MCTALPTLLKRIFACSQTYLSSTPGFYLKLWVTVILKEEEEKGRENVT
jgi:hypothetical protein